MADRKVAVYHLHLRDTPPNESLNERDYYFGSLSALCGMFDKARIGIVASSLYNFGFDETENPLFENRYCRIRKAVLITKPKSK